MSHNLGCDDTLQRTTAMSVCLSLVTLSDLQGGIEKPAYNTVSQKNMPNISQGSVATCLQGGKMPHNNIIINVRSSLQVKTYGKSVSIWKRYRQHHGWLAIWTPI